MRRAWVRILAAASLFAVAAAAGYLVSSTVGQEFLRREAERQLGRLLQGEVRIGAVRPQIHLGLRLEAHSVQVYPGPGGPGLEAARVDADVDGLALLVGRFRLRRLAIEDLQLRVVRDADGNWSPPPLAALQRRGQQAPMHAAEPRLAVLRSLDAAARVMLDRALVARLVELRGARVHFEDWRPRGARQAPVRLTLESVHGTWDHRWLSPDPELRLWAQLRDAAGRRTGIEVEGRRRDRSLRLEIAANELPLDTFDVYAMEPRADRAQTGSISRALTGSLSGVLAYDRVSDGVGEVEIDWVIRQLEVSLPRADGRVTLAQTSRAEATARLSVHPGRLRLESGRIGGDELALELSGWVERPLRESARARVAASLTGLGLEELRAFAEDLPERDRERLRVLLDKAQSGRVAELRASGSTRIATWRRLLSGQLTVLPDGFVLGADIEQLAVEVAEDDRLELAGGSFEWSGDRFDLQALRGDWNGDPLPELSLTAHGISRLFDAPEASLQVRGGAAPLPGLPTLVEWIRELGPDSPEAEPEALPPIHVEIDSLQHPVLRWPVSAAELRIEALDPDGYQVAIEAGRWAGAAVRGEVVVLDGSVSASLRLLEPAGAPEAQVAQAAEGASDGAREQSWAAGHFWSLPAADSALGYRAIRGAFELRGSTLTLRDVLAELLPTGEFEALATLQLGEAGRVVADASIEIREGDLGTLCPLFGLPTGFATGRLRLAGSLGGELVAGVPALASLTGSMAVEARDGEIHQRIPLLVALAHAVEGLALSEAREVVPFESLDAVLRFDRGLIRIRELELEGPTRVYASGELDTAREVPHIDAVVGVFLFRQADQLMGNLPLVGRLVTDPGLVAAYFSVEGPIAEPEIDALEAKTLAGQMPGVVKAPFRVLQQILSGGSNGRREGAEELLGTESRRAPGKAGPRRGALGGRVR